MYTLTLELKIRQPYHDGDCSDADSDEGTEINVTKYVQIRYDKIKDCVNEDSTIDVDKCEYIKKYYNCTLDCDLGSGYCFYKGYQEVLRAWVR